MTTLTSLYTQQESREASRLGEASWSRKKQDKGREVEPGSTGST